MKLHRHRYTNWSEPFGREHYYYGRQDKTCTVCNKIVERMVGG